LVFLIARLTAWHVEDDLNRHLHHDNHIPYSEKRRIVGGLLVALIVAAAGGLYAGARAAWDSHMSPPPLVTISCAAESFPIQIKQSETVRYGILLHPEWKSLLQSGSPISLPIGAISLWPNHTKQPGIGYRCWITNGSDKALIGVTVAFEVTFRETQAPSRAPIVPRIPSPIGLKESFVLYIADDTEWNAEVRLPESISAQIGDDTDSVEIPVRYPAGQPIRLRGFKGVLVRPFPQ
jgi:hypothetical protein